MLLPEQLTIVEIAEWKESLDPELLASKSLIVDVSELKQIDTAGLQSLLAMKLEIEKNGGSMQLQGESDVLEKGAAWLGLTQYFRASS